MTPYRHIPPGAYRPLPDARPLWQEPSPVVEVAYPQPPPPGEEYLYDQRFVYCAGGASNRGVTLSKYAGTKDRSRLQQMTWDPYAVAPMVPVMGSRSVALMEEDLDLMDDDFDDGFDDDLDGGIDPWDQMMVQIGLTREEAEIIEAFGAGGEGLKKIFKRREPGARKRRAPGARPKVVEVFRRALDKVQQAASTASYKARAAKERLDDAESARAPAPAAPAMLVRQPVNAPPSGSGPATVATIAGLSLLFGLAAGYAVGKRN